MNNARMRNYKPARVRNYKPARVRNYKPARVRNYKSARDLQEVYKSSWTWIFVTRSR
jgi:hypothetical protein